MADANTNRSGFQKARVLHLDITVKFYPRYVDKRVHPYLYSMKENVPDQVMLRPNDSTTITYADKTSNNQNVAYYPPYTEFSVQM